MDKIIDGKNTRNELLEKLQKDIATKRYTPKLVVILVGEDKASQIYVKNKAKTCEKIGVTSEVIKLSENTTEEELLQILDKNNKDKTVNGILVQLPLPKHISEDKVIEAIDPLKDVDCFHPINVGNLYTGNAIFMPCTPYGIICLLEKYDIDLEGKSAVVIGRSNIVGKPMAQLLLQKNATVTICHSRTKNLQEVVKQADIVVVAIGKSKFVTKDFIKDGAVVIDVGMHRDEHNKLCGDVDFDDVLPVVSKITPVPGGVGPMTIASLMVNCVEAYKMQNDI